MSDQPILQSGTHSPAVSLCQQRLNGKGFHVDVDGIFGAGTRRVVEQFQASCGLPVDGVVGPMTWHFLMSEGLAPTPSDVIAEARRALLAQIPSEPDPRYPVNPQARAVLEAAISRLGAKEVPDGSNGGPEIADIVEDGEHPDGLPPSAYYLYCGVTDKETLRVMPAWCCLFVCWALRKGLQAKSWKDIPFGDWFGGCGQVETWAQQQRRWRPITEPSYTEAGTLFTISREASGSDASSSPGAGHIGFVVAQRADHKLVTIEGNVSNKVGSHVRDRSELRGFIRWW